MVDIRLSFVKARNTVSTLEWRSQANALVLPFPIQAVKFVEELKRTFRPDLEGISDRAQAVGNDALTESSQDVKSVASESLNGIDARGSSRWQIA
jgi:hypothetical protein